MPELVIWHNAQCSKSCATLALLNERGLAPKIIAYLETPPSAAEIRAAAALLGFSSVRQLMRANEAAYRENGLDDPRLSETALADAMQKAPALIERPVVFANGGAAIGRPPEAALAIL